MGVLAQVVNSDDYYRDANSNSGNDKVSTIARLLQKNGVTSPTLALQLATNYANLGNVSKYQQSPY
jgi:hypothetical protein